MNKFSKPHDNRLAGIDTLRGVASIGVSLFYHYTHFSSQFQTLMSAPLPEAPLFGNSLIRLVYLHGDLFVDFFFILSGYVMAHVYLDRISECSINFKEFIWLRLARLYPLHFLTTIATAILALAYLWLWGRHPIYGNNDLVHFVLNVAFLQSGVVTEGFSFNGPAWSLSVEMFCYIIFYIICRKKCAPRVIQFMPLLGALLFTLPLKFNFLLNSSIERGVLGFFLGALLWQALQGTPFLRVVRTIGLIGPIWWIHHKGFGMYAAALAISVFILFIVNQSTFVQSALDHRVFSRIGELSYSIYLIHVPVQIMVLSILKLTGTRIPFSSPLFFVVVATAILVTSSIVYTKFELPLRAKMRGMMLL